MGRKAAEEKKEALPLSQEEFDKVIGSDALDPNLDSPAPEVPATKPGLPLLIETAEQAIQYVKDNGYTVPKEVTTVFVTSDRQVFYNGNPAAVYTKEKNVKLYSIRWEV